MNFEYEDFYKFIVSIGIGLLSLAVLVPWLFLKEPFDLLTPEADIQTLTPIAQSIIQERQTLIRQIIELMPYFSISSSGLGLVMIVLGGMLWWRKGQKVQDEMQQVNLALMRQQLETATREEVEDARIEEAKLEYSDPNVIDEVVTKVATIEEELTNKLKRCYASVFYVLANQRLGDTIFDIILLSRDRFRKSLILELKYAGKEFNYGWLRRGALQLSNKNRLYQLDANQIPISILLVVAPEKVLSATDTSSYAERIVRDRVFRKGKSRILFLAEEELEKLTCSRLADLLLL